MRTVINFLLVFMTLFASSCSKHGRDDVNVKILFFLQASERISDELNIGASYRDTLENYFNPYSDTVFTIYPKDGILSKENFILYIYPQEIRSDDGFTVSADRDSALIENRRLFLKEKGQHIVKEINDNICFPEPYPHYPGNQRYIYAGIRSGARIYADKTLFGREAGSNLNDYFIAIYSPLSMIVASYPDYRVLRGFKESAATADSFEKFFLEGRSLSGSMSHLTLNSIPDENYDEITFTIEIPIYCEGWPRNACLLPPVTDSDRYRVLKGSVTLNFGELYPSSGGNLYYCGRPYLFP